MSRFKRCIPLTLVFLMVLALAIPAYAVATSTITVKYVTGAKNSTIAKSRTITGEPGDHFQVKVRDIKGYTFIGFTDKEDNDFIFPDGKGTVLVHYAKNVTATIKYVDEYGDTLAASTKVSGLEGQSYTVSTPYIQGHDVLRVEDPRNGLFSAKDHTVKVVYSGGPNNNKNWGPNQAQLLVQSVDQNTNRVLRVVANQSVPVGTRIDLSTFKHGIAGYSLCNVLVNGSPALTQVITIAGDTTINYLYAGSQPWPGPITRNVTLIVYAVDEPSGEVITVLENRDVQQGSTYSLNPPSLHGYSFDYTEVNGGTSHGAYVTLDYDTNITYYYYPLLLGDTSTNPDVYTSRD